MKSRHWVRRGFILIGLVFALSRKKPSSPCWNRISESIRIIS
jgi:hypothetical protein